MIFFFCLFVFKINNSSTQNILLNESFILINLIIHAVGRKLKCYIRIKLVFEANIYNYNEINSLNFCHQNDYINQSINKGKIRENRFR